MTLDKYRTRFDSFLTRVGRRFIRFNPNSLSIFSLLYAIIGSISYFFGEEFLILAAICIGLNGFFDAIDGSVARLKGRETLRGDFLDDIVDRYSDTLVILGMTLSKYGNIILGTIAIAGILLTSYLGIQAKAVGLAREVGGLLGRADRVIILTIAPIAQYFFIGKYYGLTTTSIFLLFFAIFANFTVIQRAIKIWKRL